MHSLVDSESYLILTNTVPIEPYRIDNEHTVQAVKTNKAMFDGFSIVIPHGYCAIMSLPSLSSRSYEVYRDLGSFHSFACDDPETYDYAERRIDKKCPDSKLRLIHNKNYFYERTVVSSFLNEHKKYRKTKRINAIEFDQFPLVVYPTDAEVLGQEPSEEEMETIRSKGVIKNSVEPEYREIVDYGRAFQAFCSLREVNKKVYGAICLYVFARNLREFSEVYHNDYCVTAFYIAILEALAGRPPRCINKPTCDCCKQVLEHDNPTLESYFLEKYGESFGTLRKIRHKFFHGVEYYSLVDAMYDFYYINENKPELSEEEALTEDKLWHYRNEVDRLQKVVRLNLLKSLMNHY